MLAMHDKSQIGMIIHGVDAFVAFVVVALARATERLAPQGEQGAPEVGRNVKMIQ